MRVAVSGAAGAGTAGAGGVPAGNGGRGGAGEDDYGGAAGNNTPIVGGESQGGLGEDGGGGLGGGPDAAGEGGGGPIVSPVAPTAFRQLVLWLEATLDTCDLVDNSELERWRDRTRFQHVATPVSWLRPTLVDGRANGHGVVRFKSLDGAGGGDAPTSLSIPTNTALEFGTQDFCYLVVAQWSNNPAPRVNPADERERYYGGGGFLLAKQGANHPFVGVLMAANYPSIFYSTEATTRFAVQLSLVGSTVTSHDDELNDSRFRLYEVRRQGSDVSLRINGTPQNGIRVPALMDLSAADSALLIGGGPAQPLVGEIAEIVALKGRVSDGELASLEHYLLQKYAL